MIRFLASLLIRSHWYRLYQARRDFGTEADASVVEGLLRLAAELRALRVVRWV